MPEFKACFEHYTYTLCWEGNAIRLSAVGAGLVRDEVAKILQMLPKYRGRGPLPTVSQCA